MFRILGSGAFCLTHSFPEIENDFEDYKDLVIWHTINDLVAKIKDYLQLEGERKKIAKQGCLTAHNNFTWHHFAENLLKIANTKTMEEKIDWVTLIPQVALFKRYAQFQEEAIFDFIFKNIGTTNKYLVDFGAGGLGCDMSNSKYLLECGWEGLRMDGNPNGDETIQQEMITAENIVSLFEKYKVPKEFDFLSIDIDGVDLYVLCNLLDAGYSPRVIINEFNGCLSDSASIAIKNNPEHIWLKNDYYGASFSAFKKVLNKRGYTLVYQIATTNMIFIKSDLVEKPDYNITYTPAQYHTHFEGGQWVEI